MNKIITNTPTTRAVTFFLLSAALIVTISYVLIHSFIEIEKTHTFQNLSDIGKFKANQVQAYLQGNKKNAHIYSKFMENASIRYWLSHTSTPIPDAIRLPLETAPYGGTLLLDTNAVIHFRSGQYTTLSESAKAIALQTIQTNTLTVSSIYFGDSLEPNTPMLDVFVPITSEDASTVVGVLVLRDDLRSLFALLQSWPVESSSAEALMITRDGNAVLFLNELRYKKDTALKFRIPMPSSNSSTDLPAVQLIHGYYGNLESHDYRGKPVLAHTIAIPDTPWGLVVKVDTEEVLGHTKRLQLLTIAIAVVFIMCAGIIVWLHRRSQIVEEQTAKNLRVAAIAFETQSAMVITDTTPKILRVNQAFQDITGYLPEEVVGKNPKIISSPKRKPKEFYQDMWAAIKKNGKWSGELWDQHKNGKMYPKRLTITAVTAPDGTITNYVGSFVDITEQKKAEDNIHRLAFYDSLTNLPNRRLLLDRLQHAIATSARSCKYGAIMFIDLDNFKTINDTKGHDFGDMLLIEAAHRLQSCVREGDTVARLGGDEFVVMLEDLGPEVEHAISHTEEIGKKILNALNHPYVINNYEHHSTASIGINLFVDHSNTAATLLKRADIAMYQAKELGKNALCFFDPQMQAILNNHLSVEYDLRQAITQHQFELYYQPQVNNKDQVFGVEALIRWNHPIRGTISPIEFIPIAEESSLILDIGSWVIDTACKQIAEWKNNKQLCNLVVAINVSARQFKLTDFVETVDAAIKKYQINPSQLKIELTESVVLTNVDDIVKKMNKLKEIGVGLALDDFGTGYSSLSYLKRLPLDQLKIDRSFISDVVTNTTDAIMVKTIIDMAKNFHMTVVAEGVETEEQLAFLKQCNCDAFQGYLFSKPVPADQVSI